MPNLSEQIKGRIAQSASLLDALDAVTHVRAGIALVLTVVATAVAMAVLGGLSAWMAARVGFVGNLLFVLSFLVWLAIGLVGTTTAGILLSDDVWGREQKSLIEALTAASLCVHRLVVVLLLALAIVVAFLIVLALLLFVCKLPWLGPVLYAVVFPIGAVAAGVLMFALFYVVLPLAAPSIWNGNGISQTLAAIKVALRHRLFHIFILALMLTLMTSIVAATIGFILFSGTGIAASLSLAVIGFGGNFGNAIADITSDGVGGYAVAFGVDMAILMLLAGVPVTLIAMKGMVLIHKIAVAGLALGDAESALQRFFDSARHRLQSAREPSPPAAAPAAKRICPNAQCGAPVGPDDHFCVECGQKLK